MLAEMYRRRKDKELQEALENLRRNRDAEWRAWLQRKAEAERAGEEFTEPSPDKVASGASGNGL